MEPTRFELLNFSVPLDTATARKSVYVFAKRNESIKLETYLGGGDSFFGSCSSMICEKLT